MKKEKMIIYALQVYKWGTEILTYQTLYKNFEKAQKAKEELQPVFEGHYITIEGYTVNDEDDF